VIVNSLVPGPAVPTITPQSDITAVPTISTLPPGTGCDRATFVSDVTAPDGTDFTPGQAFTKTWRFRNTGTCTWNTNYSLVFSTGDQMGGPASINLPSSVAPGQTIDLSVNLTAPTNAGSYRGYWLFKNTSGNVFGIGVRADKPFWLAIDVVGTLPPNNPNGYDFAAHACDAQWASGVGALACPDQSDTDGTILIVNNPRLENNTVDSRPALLTVPQNIFNGFIQGTYPAFAVQAGDHFKSIVNCEYLQKSCYVAFRLDYRINNGPIQNLWAFGERYDGLYYQADVDLSPLAGQNVQFILRVNANGSPTGDRAMWVAPSIVRNSVPVAVAPTMTATPLAATATLASAQTTTPVPAVATATFTLVPTPTATLPPVNNGQSTYTNQKYGFQFTYPSNGVITTSQDTFTHINLPFTAGTNLVEKYLEVTVAENTSTCTSPLTQGHAPGSFSSQTVTTTTGLQFVRESLQEGAAGQIYDWVAYSITKGATCISLNFVLHSTNPSNYPVPPPVYNKDLESAAFLDIVSSFSWTTP
jgi:Ig-like domain-containing protein